MFAYLTVAYPLPGPRSGGGQISHLPGRTTQRWMGAGFAIRMQAIIEFPSVPQRWTDTCEFTCGRKVTDPMA